MSGIVGIYYRDGRPVRHATPDRMLASIGHRGPDGQGIWCGGPVGLGQCMLRTTLDSARDRQPRLNHSADLILVTDARLDNREELIKAIPVLDRPTVGIPDSQIILLAYQKWGESCPERLIGDYAFAVWDTARKHLFCARDVVGVKPFYYLLTEDCFAFASEIKALKTLPQFSACVDENKIANYLLWSFDDLEATFYKDIRKLKPAHSFIVTADVATPRCYWSLDPEREIRMASQSAYVEAFQELFTEAVRSRMRCAYPIGSTLSGGLDSSSISCTAQHLRRSSKNDAITVISAIFRDLPKAEQVGVDESRYIQAVLDRGGFRQFTVYPEEYSPMLDSQKLYSILDEPFFAPTQFIFWALYQGAKEAGLRVLLDGTDGDSTVSHGEPYIADLTHSFRWRAAYRSAASLASVQALSLRSVLWNYALAPVLPRRIVDAIQSLRGARNREWKGKGLLDATYALRLQISIEEMRFHEDRNTGYISSRYKHYAELTSPLIPLALELFDMLAASHSLELRFPFFDRRLMEFCLALPPELKFDQGWSRYILRAAMDGVLPSEVQWRTTKANLPLAFARQFMRHERQNLDQAITHSSRILPGVIEPEVLRQAYSRCRQDPVRHLNETYAVFGAVNLQNWLKSANVQV